MKNLYHILVILIVIASNLSLNLNCYSQDSPGQIKKYVKKGRKAFSNGEYWKSKSYYDKVTTSNTTKPQYWLEAGMVYYESKVEREQSIIFFDKALELSEQTGDTLPEIFYYRAKAFHFNGEYENAIENYNLFLTKVPNNKKGIILRQEIIREIEICNNGVDLRNRENDRYTEIY